MFSFVLLRRCISLDALQLFVVVALKLTNWLLICYFPSVDSFHELAIITPDFCAS